ncbi:GNAT family N-acetyltransferase [Jeongeupia sp. USM3]|uniref:GNAT family N-acetyltransferase n=1 Tax=Jeongeupia sp. USM3 TaxID=1906741 RepID=UPI00089DD887|nr:GNAT family N-acetyltransferase [Jeongeupia sp. USM3]AOX99500.1 hypothetical protein BJP62_02920 [Jeongeupia sp. USM3]
MTQNLRTLHIATERLNLRAFTLDDIDALHALTLQPEITDILNDWAMSREQCTQWLTWHCTRYDDFNPAQPSLPFAICLPTGEMIGWLGIWPKPSVKVDLPEVAYAISRDHRGQGYVSEAVRAASSWLFERGPLPALMAIVKPAHDHSRRVLLRSGFTCQGTVECADDGTFDYFVLARPA